MTDVSTLGSEIQAVAKEPALDVRSRPQGFKGSRGAGQRRELMVHLLTKEVPLYQPDKVVSTCGPFWAANYWVTS